MAIGHRDQSVLRVARQIAIGADPNRRTALRKALHDPQHLGLPRTVQPSFVASAKTGAASAGKDALSANCRTPWLLTVPVDALNCNDALLATLAESGGEGAVAQDDDGLQPLFALYRVETLGTAVDAAIAAGRYSVRGLQAALTLPIVRIEGVRFGNLNTPEDLAAAGCTDA